MASSSTSVKKVGKYELGRTLGEGSFAKVKYAKNVETGDAVAIKVLDKEKIVQRKLVDQISREISVMRLVRHPNIVRLIEVRIRATRRGIPIRAFLRRRRRAESNAAHVWFPALASLASFCTISSDVLQVLVVWHTLRLLEEGELFGTIIFSTLVLALDLDVQSHCGWMIAVITARVIPSCLGPCLSH